MSITTTGNLVVTRKPLGYYDRGYITPGGVVGGRKTGPVTTKFGDYIGPEKVLQRADDHVSVEAARDKAKVEAAHAITGTLPEGKRAGVKFAEAFDGYVRPTSKLSPRGAVSRRVGLRTCGTSASKSCCRNGRIGHSPK